MNRKVSVAPMMDCTDRHERYFLRLISKNVLLYTEMIVSEAIDRGDKKKLLSFNINEKPLALQVGGSSPKLLANAAKLDIDYVAVSFVRNKDDLIAVKKITDKKNIGLIAKIERNEALENIDSILDRLFFLDLLLEFDFEGILVCFL